MIEVTSAHYLQAIATLLALQHYNGKKDDGAVMHCQYAAEEIALLFALKDQARDAANPALLAELRTQQWLCVLKTAKLLGLFAAEPAGVPNTQWLDKIRGQGESGYDDWWHRFSKS